MREKGSVVCCLFLLNTLRLPMNGAAFVLSTSLYFGSLVIVLYDVIAPRLGAQFQEGFVFQAVFVKLITKKEYAM